MSIIDVLLLVVGPLLGIWLASLMLKRRMHREFPCFFGYVAASIVGQISVLVVADNYTVYYYVFWAFEVLYAVLALLALHEAFYGVFRAFFRKYRWFWTLFPAVILLVVVLATIYAMQRPPAQAGWITRLIISVEIGINVMQSCLFLLFQGAMWFFRARRRTYAMGIVDGFAVVAFAAFAYALRSEFGTNLNLLVRYGPPVAYLLAEIIWLGAFLRSPEPPPQLPAGVTLEQAFDEMAQSGRWMKDLSDKLRK
jgi:hypothetical protein